MGRLFVPEVLQTSAMDCGPASMKSLLAGMGIEVSYERLRDACGTGADGTSVDALEDMAIGLGLEAYQELAPVDDAAEILAAAAPCVAVIEDGAGAPHFVVVWSVTLGVVQLMDPARGRMFVGASKFVRDLYLHTQRFESAAFFPWWKTTAWFRHAQQRAVRLGRSDAYREDVDIDTLGKREAAARVVARLQARGAAPAAASGDLVDAFAELQAGEDLLPADQVVFRHDGPDDVTVRGAVFLVIRAPVGARPAPHAQYAGALSGRTRSSTEVLLEHSSPGSRRLLVVLAILSVMSTAVTLVEMFFLRAAFNAGALLSLPQQRFVGALLYALLVVLLLALDAALASGLLRLGRNVEVRLRMALLAKLPRLPDQYFRTRPMSDVTHRGQGLFHVRSLPEVVLVLVKHIADILVTIGALCILYPRGSPLALLVLVFGVAGPYVTVQLRQRIEARVQAHASSLGQLYLEALLGIVPLRSHGGQLAIRSKQEEYLVEWRRESDRAVAQLFATESVQGLGTLLLVALFVLGFVRSGENPSSLLLVAFWALRLPLLTRAYATTLSKLPVIRVALGRLVEPLTAEESSVSTVVGAPSSEEERKEGIELGMRHLTVLRGPRRMLDGVNLQVRAGERVAIVGHSGSGKSTLLACLLGLVPPSSGELFVDGVPIADFGLTRLRRVTVWVDPAVQLWNRSALANFDFGNPPDARKPLHPVLDQVELMDLLTRMPEGLASELGESGSRLSGGEGQRVRTARALLRSGVRLVLLDEAFRGLERPMRRRFSRALRSMVGGATVIEATHDVADTLDYDRVLVVEHGGLVEDGSPGELLARAGSRYAALVDADRRVRDEVWAAPGWKRVVVRGDGDVEVVGEDRG